MDEGAWVVWFSSIEKPIELHEINSSWKDMNFSLGKGSNVIEEMEKADMIILEGTKIKSSFEWFKDYFTKIYGENEAFDSVFSMLNEDEIKNAFFCLESLKALYKDIKTLKEDPNLTPLVIFLFYPMIKYDQQIKNWLHYFNVSLSYDSYFKDVDNGIREGKINDTEMSEELFKMINFFTKDGGKLNDIIKFLKKENIIKALGK